MATPHHDPDPGTTHTAKQALRWAEAEALPARRNRRELPGAAGQNIKARRGLKLPFQRSGASALPVPRSAERQGFIEPGVDRQRTPLLPELTTRIELHAAVLQHWPVLQSLGTANPFHPWAASTRSAAVRWQNNCCLHGDGRFPEAQGLPAPHGLSQPSQ